MAKSRLIPRVTSILDLETKAQKDPRYERLAKLAAENLGGESNWDMNRSIRWLRSNAMETDEEGVVKEINYVRDLV